MSTIVNTDITKVNSRLSDYHFNKAKKYIKLLFKFSTQIKAKSLIVQPAIGYKKIPFTYSRPKPLSEKINEIVSPLIIKNLPISNSYTIGNGKHYFIAPKQLGGLTAYTNKLNDLVDLIIPTLSHENLSDIKMWQSLSINFLIYDYLYLNGINVNYIPDFIAGLLFGIDIPDNPTFEQLEKITSKIDIKNINANLIDANIKKTGQYVANNVDRNKHSFNEKIISDLILSNNANLKNGIYKTKLSGYIASPININLAKKETSSYSPQIIEKMNILTNIKNEYELRINDPMTFDYTKINYFIDLTSLYNMKIDLETKYNFSNPLNGLLLRKKYLTIQAFQKQNFTAPIMAKFQFIGANNQSISAVNGYDALSYSIEINPWKNQQGAMIKAITTKEIAMSNVLEKFNTAKSKTKIKVYSSNAYLANTSQRNKDFNLSNLKMALNNDQMISMFTRYFNNTKSLSWYLETTILIEKVTDAISLNPNKTNIERISFSKFSSNNSIDLEVRLKSLEFLIRFSKLLITMSNSKNQPSSFKKIFTRAKAKGIYPADAIKDLEKENPFEFVFDKNVAHELTVLMCWVRFGLQASFDYWDALINDLYIFDPSGANTYAFFETMFEQYFKGNNFIKSDPFNLYMQKFYETYKINQRIKTAVLNDQYQYLTDAVASAYETDKGVKASFDSPSNLDGWFSFIPLADEIGDVLEATRDAAIFVVKKTIQNTIGSALSKSILPDGLYESLNDMSQAGLEILHGNITVKVVTSFVENAIQASLQPVALASHYVREISDEALKIHIIAQLNKYSGGLVGMTADLAATADQINQKEDIDWEKKLIQGVVVGLTIASAGSAGAIGQGLAVTTGTNIATKKTFLGKTALGKLVIKGTADVLTGKAITNALTDAVKIQASNEATKALVKSGVLGVGAASAAVRSSMDYYINDKSGSEIAQREAKIATTNTLVRNFAKNPTQSMAINFVVDRSFAEGSKYLKTEKKTVTTYKKDKFGTVMLNPDTGRPIVESTKVVDVAVSYEYEGVTKDAKVIATKVAKYHIDKKLSKYGITTDQVIKVADKLGHIKEIGSFDLSAETERIKNQIARKYEREYTDAVRRVKNAKSEIANFNAKKELAKLNDKASKEITRAQNTLKKEWENTKKNYENFDFAKEAGEEWGSIKNDPKSRFNWLKDKYGDKFLMWLIEKYGPKYSYNPTAQDYIYFQDWRPAEPKKKSLVGKILMGLIAGSVTYTIFG